MSMIDILFITGFIGIWIPQAFWAWLSFLPGAIRFVPVRTDQFTNT